VCRRWCEQSKTYRTNNAATVATHPISSKTPLVTFYVYVPLYLLVW
jgi:hypothetical protein